jgi:hypothetical protein
MEAPSKRDAESRGRGAVVGVEFREHALEFVSGLLNRAPVFLDRYAGRNYPVMEGRHDHLYPTVANHLQPS